MGFDVAEGYPMVEALILELNDGLVTTDFVIQQLIFKSFERQGPYQFCKSNGLLVNNSAEEFAVQFMSFYNKYIGYSFY